MNSALALSVAKGNALSRKSETQEADISLAANLLVHDT